MNSRVEINGMSFTAKDFTCELPPIDLNDIPQYVRSINCPLSADIECTMVGDIDGPLLQKLIGAPLDLVDDFTVQFSEPYQEQVRRHKKKRINKKWAKRYGYRTKTRIRTVENVRLKPICEEPLLGDLSKFELSFTGVGYLKGD